MKSRIKDSYTRILTPLNSPWWTDIDGQRMVWSFSFTNRFLIDSRNINHR